MKKAVILFNLGGPDKLENVEPFLFNLFNDPAILNLPSFFRYPLAKLIANRRAPTAKKIYKELGGSSPILKLTEEQAKALETNSVDDDEATPIVKEPLILPWWKQRRAKISVGVFIILLGVLALALGISLPSQDPQPEHAHPRLSRGKNPPGGGKPGYSCHRTRPQEGKVERFQDLEPEGTRSRHGLGHRCGGFLLRSIPLWAGAPFLP